MYFSWIPTCAKVFLDKNELWQHLVPPGADDSTELVEEFFACVAALMSIQLRSMIINSLADFLSFFALHKVSFPNFVKFNTLIKIVNTLLSNDLGFIYFKFFEQYSKNEIPYLFEKCSQFPPC